MIGLCRKKLFPYCAHLQMFFQLLSADTTIVWVVLSVWNDFFMHLVDNLFSNANGCLLSRFELFWESPKTFSCLLTIMYRLRNEGGHYLHARNVEPHTYLWSFCQHCSLQNMNLSGELYSRIGLQRKMYSLKCYISSWVMFAWCLGFLNLRC